MLYRLSPHLLSGNPCTCTCAVIYVYVYINLLALTKAPCDIGELCCFLTVDDDTRNKRYFNAAEVLMRAGDVNYFEFNCFFATFITLNISSPSSPMFLGSEHLHNFTFLFSLFS